jgi:hypothetical protein
MSDEKVIAKAIRNLRGRAGDSRSDMHCMMRDAADMLERLSVRVGELANRCLDVRNALNAYRSEPTAKNADELDRLVGQCNTPDLIRDVRATVAVLRDKDQPDHTDLCHRITEHVRDDTANLELGTPLLRECLVALGGQPEPEPGQRAFERFNACLPEADKTSWNHWSAERKAAWAKFEESPASV